jgi:hypothetical protein
MRKYIAWIALILIVLIVAIAAFRTFGFYARSPQTPTAAQVSAPTALPPLNLPWPEGWTVTVPPGFPRPNAVSYKARLMENGKPRAIIDAGMGLDDASTSLSDTVRIMSKADPAVAAAHGATVSTSAAVETTWRGRPALQYEVMYEGHGKVIHEHHVVTRGTGGLICALALNAFPPDFETFLPTFERLKDQFPCP